MSSLILDRCQERRRQRAFEGYVVADEMAGRHIASVVPDWDRHPLADDLSSTIAEIKCHLRPGGSARVVEYQHHMLAWGEQLIVEWATDGLSPGWYEVFCRLPADSGKWWWLLDPDGMDCEDGCYWSFIEKFEIKG